MNNEQIDAITAFLELTVSILKGIRKLTAALAKLNKARPP
jgi:hypothetical protein